MIKVSRLISRVPAASNVGRRKPQQARISRHSEFRKADASVQPPPADTPSSGIFAQVESDESRARAPKKSAARPCKGITGSSNKAKYKKRAAAARVTKLTGFALEKSQRENEKIHGGEKHPDEAQSQRSDAQNLRQHQKYNLGMKAESKNTSPGAKFTIPMIPKADRDEGIDGVERDSLDRLLQKDRTKDPL